MAEPEAAPKKKKKLSKPAIVVIVIVVLFIIGALGGGNSNQSAQTSTSTQATESTQANTSEESTAWDANSTLVGMTVEGAWDEIEQQGYTLGGILSTTGAELNSDDSVRHSSSAQTWRVEKAESDEGTKSVTLTITSYEDFVKKYGETSIKGGAAPAAESEAAAEPEMTMSQKNALKQAQNYLDYSAFSRDGLIGQLEFEGYSTEDATFAVDNCGADWNEQAAKKAQDYLDYSAFSRSGLIDQLEFEGFTTEQATYGVDSVGLN